MQASNHHTKKKKPKNTNTKNKQPQTQTTPVFRVSILFSLKSGFHFPFTNFPTLKQTLMKQFRSQKAQFNT